MLNPLTHRKILSKGRPARAVLIAFQMPERGAAKQNIQMTLQVRLAGHRPYEVEDQWLVSNKDSLGFGLELPVRVDARDPERVAIDWEAARKERADERAARRAALAAQPPVGADAPSAVPLSRFGGGWNAEGSGNGATGDDPISRLERLARLRANGVLSDEEFASEKRRILDRS